MPVVEAAEDVVEAGAVEAAAGVAVAAVVAVAAGVGEGITRTSISISISNSSTTTTPTPHPNSHTRQQQGVEEGTPHITLHNNNNSTVHPIIIINNKEVVHRTCRQAEALILLQTSRSAPPLVRDVTAYPKRHSSMKDSDHKKR